MLPTSGGALLVPSPLAPWHLAPSLAKSASPCATVPLPGGNPLPVGVMSIFQPAICSGVAGWPKPKRCSGVAIADLSIGGHRPRLDAVVVIEGMRAAHGDQLVSRRLDVAGLVDRPALQARRFAVPHPGEAEPGPGNRQHRRLQRRQRPRRAAVSRDFDLEDAAPA